MRSDALLRGASAWTDVKMRLPGHRVRRDANHFLNNAKVPDLINVATFTNTWDLAGACWVANTEVNAFLFHPECMHTAEFKHVLLRMASTLNPLHWFTL